MAPVDQIRILKLFKFAACVINVRLSYCLMPLDIYEVINALCIVSGIISNVDFLRIEIYI